MRRLLDGLITGIALVFIIPTILILISWNAIPGDSLYPLKTGLENVTLSLLSGTPLLPKASIKFTDRRLIEATALLNKKGSTVGYDLLVANAAQTKTYISQKNDVQSAVQFSNSIDTYKQQIEQTKVQVSREISQQQVAPTPRGIPVPTPTPQTFTENIPIASAPPSSTQVVVNVPQVYVILHEDPNKVLQKLNDTEEKLNQIQDEVKKNSEKQNQGNPNPGNSNSNEKNQNQDKNGK